MSNSKSNTLYDLIHKVCGRGAEVGFDQGYEAGWRDCVAYSLGMELDEGSESSQVMRNTLKAYQEVFRAE